MPTKGRLMMENKTNNTKGSIRAVFLLVLGMAVMMGSLWSSVKVSFRLSGSYGKLLEGAGDIDVIRRGMESQLLDMSQQDRYTASFDWKKPSRSNDLRAELVFRISRNFGISVGSGYIFADSPGSYAVDYKYARDNGNDYYFRGYNYETDEYADYSQKYALSAIPITLDAYVFLPIGKKETFTAFAHLGAGYYFGRLQHNLDMDATFNRTEKLYGDLVYQSEGTYDIRITEKTTSSAWGVHGGLGLDVRLTRLLTIGAEAYGRHVVFRDWEGSQVTKMEYKNKSWSVWGGDSERADSDTDSAYGNLWTYDFGCSDESPRYTRMWIMEEEPDDECYHKVRKSSINLNSYGFSVSIKLSFNLF
jgi:hypothetical protein